MKGYKAWLSPLFLCLVLLEYFSTLASLAVVHSAGVKFAETDLLYVFPHRCLSLCLICGVGQRSTACAAHVNGHTRGYRCVCVKTVSRPQVWAERNDTMNVLWLWKTALVNLLSLVQLSHNKVICQRPFYRRLSVWDASASIWQSWRGLYLCWRTWNSKDDDGVSLSL